MDRSVFKINLTEDQSCEIVKIVPSFQFGHIAGAPTGLGTNIEPSDVKISSITFYKNVKKIIINYYFLKDNNNLPLALKGLTNSYTLLESSIFKSQIIEYQNVSNWYKSYIRDYLIDEIIESNC